MKDIYKDTFIYKLCDTLKIDLKELAFKMNKHNKTIENWRKDENSIPQLDKEYMKLLMENKQLENEIKKYHKHKLEIDRFIESDIFGKYRLNLAIQQLKPKTMYRIILEEV